MRGWRGGGVGGGVSQQCGKVCVSGGGDVECGVRRLCCGERDGGEGVCDGRVRVSERAAGVAMWRGSVGGGDVGEGAWWGGDWVVCREVVCDGRET